MIDPKRLRHGIVLHEYGQANNLGFKLNSNEIEIVEQYKYVNTCY
jgi:hypothetical protein